MKIAIGIIILFVCVFLSITIFRSLTTLDDRIAAVLGAVAGWVLAKLAVSTLNKLFGLGLPEKSFFAND